jgi:release factor H-coupled RctB family protein
MGNPHSGSEAAANGGRITHYFTDTAWMDGRATQQLAATATLPGMIAVAGYPDLHPGRNGTVGAAFLADRLFPTLVGNDIGCGMALFTLDLAPRKLSLNKAARRLRALEGQWDDAPEARGFGFGTIGGGNHFCEVQAVEALTDAGTALGLTQDRLCLLVHSGSRGLGESAFRRTEGQPFLDPDSAEGLAYLADHDRAVEWSAANRLAIATRAARALNADLHLVADASHNLLVQANGAWLHRKGAAVATGAAVPLAGSRDSFSYLLAPTGAADTPFASLSHGAGCKHDRASMHGRIRKSHSSLQAQIRTALGGMVLCEDPDLLIEEAGAAYKSAAGVLADLQALGLAQAIATLRPVLTYKKTVEGR